MKCPGQDSRYWKPGSIFDVKCPECGASVEFFKDDTTRKCDSCGHRFVNPDMDFGCAAYCQYAEKCLGDLPPEMAAQREDFLKDKVAVEMKRYFRRDFKRIGHASRTARYAERIGKVEQGNMAVVLASAYLHDIGAGEAQRKHGDDADEFVRQESPAVARSILEKLGANERMIAEVCDMVGHRLDEEASRNFQILLDADMIASFEEKQKQDPVDPESMEKAIEGSFRTESGRKEARSVLLQN